MVHLRHGHEHLFPAGSELSGLPGAAEVFTAIGPFATPAPWQHVSGSRWWQDDFLQARNYAMKRERYQG
jgi:hypothetical protein